MKVLILAAGGQVNDPALGEYPLFLSELSNGGLLIEKMIDACKALATSGFVICLRQNDIVAHHLDDIIELITSGCHVVEVKRETMGAACTALLAVDYLDFDEELIVTTASDYVDEELQPILAHFRNGGADAGAIIFDALHPRYSYARLDEDKRIIESAEKRPISRHALAGFYWFKRGGDFVDAVQAMISKDVRVHGRYFVAPALNELVLKSKTIATYRIPSKSYHPFKSRAQLNNVGPLGEHVGQGVE